MKKLLLGSLILLNGCVFNDMMTSVNSSLKNANDTLSGTGTLKDNKNNSNDDNVDCEKDSLAFQKWHKQQSKSEPKFDKKMSRLQYKLIRYCNDRYASNAYIHQGVNEVK